MAEGECTQLLADLASEYERSRRFLFDLEESLQHRCEAPVKVAGAESCVGQGADPEEEAGSSAQPVSGLKGRFCWTGNVARTSQSLGGFAKLLHLTRNPSHRQKESNDAEELVEPRRPSVVNLGFGEPVERAVERRRSLSFYSPSGPTTVNTSGQLTARPSSEVRQQRFESTGGALLSTLRRNSLEQSSFSGVRPISQEAALASSSFKSASSASCGASMSAQQHSAALPDIVSQSGGQRQPPPRRLSGGVYKSTSRSSLGPTAPVAPAGDSGPLTRPIGTRRATIDLGLGTAFTEPPPQQQQPHGDQCCPPSPAAGTEPITQDAMAMAGLLAVGRPSSFKLPPCSSSGLAEATAGAATRATQSGVSAKDAEEAAAGAASMRWSEYMDVTPRSNSGTVPRRLSMTSMSHAAAATGRGMPESPSAGSAGGNSSGLHELRVTPMRSRSMRTLSGAPGLQPAGVQMAPSQRNCMVRLPSVGGDSSTPGEAAEACISRRQSSTADDSVADVNDGQTPFRGTMHLI